MSKYMIDPIGLPFDDEPRDAFVDDFLPGSLFRFALWWGGCQERQWVVRWEEREVQESKERKETEDKRMKISLAQTLMSSGYPEIEAVAKRKILKGLHTL